MLGVDLSHWQDPAQIPWRTWKAGGLEICCVQLTHGSRLEEHGGAHLGGAIAAGVASIGAYHYLTPAAANWQAQVFTAALAPGVTWAMLDIEEFGIVADDVLDFCDYFDAHSALPLYLYGNNRLAAIMAGNPELRRYKVWWAEYANKLPTSSPPYAAPKHVPPGLRLAAWQFTGTGRLAPYKSDIDLSVWYETPGAKVMTVPMVATGPKLGIHSITPGNTLALVSRAVDAGWHWPLVKILHDASVCAAVKAISPKTLTICRYMPASADDEGLQGVENWTHTQMEAWAKRLVDLIFSRTASQHMAAVDYFDPTNEPGAHGVAYYTQLGTAFCYLVLEADSRGVHLSLPALPQGVPEYDEMVALRATGLFKLMRAGGHIFDVHEGAFVGQPIDFGYGDLIPGAPHVPPGAGSTSFRHKYLYEMLGPDEIVPLVVSEFYGGGRYTDSPASQLARFRWYDERARAEPYLLAFCPFTINPDATWHDEDYGPTYDSAELWAYIAGERNLPNATGDDTMDTQKALDAIRAAQASLTLAADALAPTWKAGDVAVAVANPLQLYTAVHTTSGLPRPDYTSDIDVFEVSADGAWLKVFQVPALWVKTADVRHK